MMGKQCALCGKGTSYGNQISHSHRVTARRWKPNLQRIRIVLKGHRQRAYVCTRCIKSNKVERAI